MILVDSSVLIDLLGDRQTPETSRFFELVGAELTIAIGDLMLVEVLQGVRHDRPFRRAVEWLSRFETAVIAGPDVALAAAVNYRLLRARGITVRKTINTLIATRCILDGVPLLYSDRDFDPFVEHLGLRPALATTGGC